MKYSNFSRVYFNSLISQDQTLIITKSNDNNIFHYLKNVLRLGIGDNFRIFNSNNGEFLAEIIIVKKNELTIEVTSLLRQEVLDTPLILALCIIKSEKMLEAIKAAVQLGVTEIVPIIAERSQYKQVNQQRFQRAIIEAVEQSERLLLPKIVTPISLNDFCNRKDIEQIIFANEMEKKLRTVANPDVEDVVNEEDKDVEFTLKFELNPEIKMPNFKQIAIEKPVLNVNDKDIDAEIEKFASLSKSYDKEKKDKAKKGDQVTINAVGYIDDKAFDGGKLDNHKLVLGSGSFIEGFEKQLEGTKAGDDIVVKVTFPKDYHAKDLAGKPAEFKVNVVTIHSETKTKIDDEFAKKFQCENLQELKKQVKENIATEYSRHVSGLIKMKLFNKLEDMLKFNVPKSLLNKELESLKQQMSGSEEEDPSLKKKSAKEKEENYLKLATRRVRLGLLLAEYIREKNLQITGEDVKKAILDQARNFPGQEQQIIDFYTNNKNAVESLTGPMLEEKAVKEIFDKEITMTEKAYNKEELKKLLEKEELQD